MNDKEAELVLECMAVDMTGALCDTKEPMRDVLKQRIEAINIAQKVLRENDSLPGEPLTLEQLREMGGKPVFLITKYRGNFLALVNKNSVYSGERVYFFDDDGSYYGDTWTAYHTPPAHIDREAWKPCELCNKPEYFMRNHYCQHCGRPLTEEA